MKKVLSMVLTIVMLVSVFSTVLNLGGVSAESFPAKPTVSPSNFIVDLGEINASPNEYINVPLTFENIPEIGVSVFNMTISYDPNCLEYLAYETDNIVPNPNTNFSLNKERDGIIKMVFLDYNMKEPIKSDGLVANLKFKVLNQSNKSTLIDITNATFGDYQIKNINAKLVQGKVNISSTPVTTPIPENEFTVKVGSEKALVGDKISIPVNFTNVPSKGISTCNLTISYDPHKLEYVSYDAGKIIDHEPDYNFKMNRPHDGLLKLLFLDYTLDYGLITSNGTFVNLTFKVLDADDESTCIHVTDSAFGDSDINPLKPTVVPGVVDISGTLIQTPTPTQTGNFTVNVGTAEGKIGDEVKIPISIENVPSTGIDELYCKLSYNPSKLKYISNRSKGLTEDILINGNQFKKEVVLLFSNINYDRDKCIKEDGEIAVITFEILDSSAESIPLQINNYDFCYNKDKNTNMEKIDAIVNAGSVNVIESILPTHTPTSTPIPTPEIQINVGSAKGKTGDLVTVPISFKDVPKDGISTADMMVNYDPTQLQCVSIEAGNIVPNSEMCFDKNNPYNGNIKLLYVSDFTDSSYISADGVFAYVTFKVLGSYDKATQISASYVTVGDKYLDSVLPNTVSGAVYISGTEPAPSFQVEIGSNAAYNGDFITIPVSFANIPIEPIQTVNMTLNYDLSQLEYVSCEPGSNVPVPSCNFAVNKQPDGKLKILYTDYLFELGNVIRFDGVIVKLKFRVLSSGESTVYASDAKFYDQKLHEVKATLVPGKISLFGKPLITEEPIGYTVSGCVYSDFTNNNLSKFPLNEGFKVELAETAFSAVTDSNGYFEIKNVPAGKYTAVMTKTNHLSRYIENISIDKDKVLSTASSPITLWYGDIEENGKNDGAINLEDIMEICKVFNTVSGDGKYKENLDLNKDGAINLEDIMIIAKNFNKCSSDYQ